MHPAMLRRTALARRNHKGADADAEGKPLAGAKVFVSGLTPHVIEFRERTTSGLDGTFRFSLRRDEFGRAQAELATSTSSQPGVYVSGVRVRFDGDVHYRASQGASDVTVIARTPEITWAPPAPIAESSLTMSIVNSRGTAINVASGGAGKSARERKQRCPPISG